MPIKLVLQGLAQKLTFETKLQELLCCEAKVNSQLIPISYFLILS